jgi:hypothetical protein
MPSEKKTGFLLIETFRKTKLWPPGFDPWWPFSFAAEGNLTAWNLMIASLVGLHFPTSNCENVPEPCGDFNKSAGLLYVNTSEKKIGLLL